MTLSDLLATLDAIDSVREKLSKAIESKETITIEEDEASFLIHLLNCQESIILNKDLSEFGEKKDK